MIEINITKRVKTYKGWEDLKIDTKFQSEKTTKIVGPSGAGKTTLLKMIAGLITPDAGTIRVNGIVWFDSENRLSRKIQERGVGFVFQDYALFPNMTVEEHLRYGTKDIAYHEKLLSLGEMEAFQKNIPAQLSGGQQQRLAILRALSTKPTLLLMDEAFSAMDQKLKSKMTTALTGLFRELKITVLMVTHDEQDVIDSVETFRMEE